MINISQKALKLITFLVLFSIITNIGCAKSISVTGKTTSHSKTHSLINDKNLSIRVTLAITDAERTKGLSGVMPSEFSFEEGMLFISKFEETQHFWMPNTYFNLDIIFLDRNLKIVGIEKDVPFHNNSIKDKKIYRTDFYLAQYVLETKSGSPFSKDLKKGDKLEWKSTISLSEIVQGIRLGQ